MLLAPSSKITSIRIKTFFNGSLSEEAFLESNPSIELPEKDLSNNYVIDIVIQKEVTFRMA